MFSKSIVDSDAFLDMPLTTQGLYFHLSMRADDDGFLNSAKKIQKMVGANDQDLSFLIQKKFIIMFDDGVCLIKHWKINNYIAKDRYKKSVYDNHKKQIEIKENGAYTRIQSVDNVHDRIQSVDNVHADKISIDKNRIDTTPLPHTRPETVDNSVDNYPQPKPPRFYLKSDWVVEKTDQRVVSAARLINIAVDDISDHAFNQALLAFRGMSAQREFNDELAAINVFCAKYLRSALLKPSKQPIEQPTRELTREERRAIQDKKYENDEANFNRGRWDKKNNEGDQNV